MLCCRLTSAKEMFFFLLFKNVSSKTDSCELPEDFPKRLRNARGNITPSWLIDASIERTHRYKIILFLNTHTIILKTGIKSYTVIVRRRKAEKRKKPVNSVSICYFLGAFIKCVMREIDVSQVRYNRHYTQSTLTGSVHICAKKIFTYFANVVS